MIVSCNNDNKKSKKNVNNAENYSNSIKESTEIKGKKVKSNSKSKSKGVFSFVDVTLSTLNGDAIIGYDTAYSPTGKLVTVIISDNKG